MSYVTPYKFFDVGVFAETLANIDVFSSNLYLAQMLTAAVEQYEEIQIEYEQAVEQRDEELQKQKEMELKMCEGNFAMASAMLDLWGENYS